MWTLWGSDLWYSHSDFRNVVIHVLQAYQSLLVSYRQSVDAEDSVKQLDWFVKSDEDLTHLPLTPTFHEDQYENGIRVVSGEQILIRKCLARRRCWCQWIGAMGPDAHGVQNG